MDLKQQIENYFLEYKIDYDNKHGIRWLNKRLPDLWRDILNSTSFLPLDAKPKQRVWHILNNIYERPICPTTKQFTKWHENRYLTYKSVKAKANDPEFHAKKKKTFLERNGVDHWSKIPEKVNQYRETFNINREAGKHTIVESPFKRKEVQDICKQTMLDRYGVDNASKSEQFIQKIRDSWAEKSKEEIDIIVKKSLKTKLEKGLVRSEEEKSLQELYYLKVSEFTKQSWWNHYSKINTEKKTRGKQYHLDHKYSIKEGFKNNIPAEIIGHWTNLQLLPSKINNGKCSDCWKTIDQLYEDYNKFENLDVSY